MMVYRIVFVVSKVLGLSWRCDSPEFGDISYSHFLYKEDNVNEVKWLEKFDYCLAKGDPSVYSDAGQGKCEYSRGLCYWDNGCYNTGRGNDPVSECQDLFYNNALVPGLDNGRQNRPTTIVVEQPPTVVEQPPTVVEQPPVVVEQPPVVVEQPTTVVEQPPVVVEQTTTVDSEQSPDVMVYSPVSSALAKNPFLWLLFLI